MKAYEVEKNYKLSQYGRNRTLSKRGAITVIPGARFTDQWQRMVDTFTPHRQQIRPSVGAVDDFYRGWVLPLGDIHSEYCGCKMNLISVGNGITVLNVEDVFDLAVNTSIIPLLFPGSTPSSYNGAGRVGTAECGTHGEFNTVSFDSNTLRVGIELLSKGEVFPFSLSLVGWESLESVTKKYIEPVSRVLVDGMDYKVFSSAVSRLARMCASSESSAYSPLRVASNYADIRRSIYQPLLDHTDPERAFFLTALLLTQSYAVATEFRPTEEEMTLLDDDDFVRSLIVMLRRSQPVESYHRWGGYPQNPSTDFRLFLRAVEHGIDFDLIKSTDAA